MPSRGLSDECGQLVERTLPTLVMAIEAGLVGERTMDKGEFGLASEGAEGDLDRGLLAIAVRAPVARLIGPGEDEAFGPFHFAIDARLGEARSVGPVSFREPGAARPGIELAAIEPGSRRAHPGLELISIGPGVEAALARRIEHTHETKRLGGENRIHSASPSFDVSNGRAGAPRPSGT